MSQTALHEPLTSLWNKSAPLRVLVIEQSVNDAELSIQVLRRAGFDCRPHIISTRPELRAQLGRFPYDVVLAAYRLSGWSVMEALSDLRRAGREAPFILVTGGVGEEVAVECIRQGVTDYVLKRDCPVDTR